MKKLMTCAIAVMFGLGAFTAFGAETETKAPADPKARQAAVKKCMDEGQTGKDLEKCIDENLEKDSKKSEESAEKTE